MEDLSLHILDIAENSIAAGARGLSITVSEDVGRDLLTIEIVDDGKGMNAELAEKAADPFFTTRTTRKVGMGLALLKEAAAMANGTMEIRSAPNEGTTIRGSFQFSHIDRKPLGNMADTIVALIANDAEVNILYKHARDGKVLVFDTKLVRTQLGDILLNSVEALNLIRSYLDQEEATLAH
ncbi:MAG: ATP-binding protein [Ignavibacteria bacterium]|nr:ATP-binding protein [Ignavibacteria bacterium]